MARNSIILNGKSSDTITGLIIQELPPISKPLMRSQVEEIDGRDGDIITKLGFSAYDKEISVGLYGNFDINEIIAYFNSEGTVTFSNEPDKFYYYQILEQIDFERLVRFRTATINFHVQPFKYSTTEEAETIEAGTVSGEGNNLVLENTSDAPFSKLTPKGDAFQQTYSGKNLFNWVGMPNKTAATDVSNATYNSVLSNGVEVTGNTSTATAAHANSKGWYRPSYSSDNSTYRVHISSTQSVTVSADVTLITLGFAASMRVYLDGSTAFTPSSDNQLALGQTVRVSHTFNNVSEGDYYPIFTLASNQVKIENIQIELGSTATDYEKFVGGIASPNPDYPQDIQVVTGEQTIKVTGKNLFNPASLYHGYYTASNPSQMTSDEAYRTAVIDNLPAGTYTFSTDLTNCYFLRWAINSTNTTLQVARNTQTVTITESGTFKICFRNTSTTTITQDLNCQLELGSTATAYEPYQGQSYPISLGSTELANLGDYQDYIWKDNGTWKVHKETGKVVFGGTEAWVITTNNNAFYVTKSDAITINQDTTSPILSDNYTANTYRALYNATADYGISYHPTSARIIIRNKDITTAADFKTWLSTHNTTVYYALATPTDTAITDETLISQLEALNAAHAYKGRTHIISTAGSDANLPHIIEAKVLGSSDTTITNSGNFISKPKFTIYGSGNIGLYINGIQILQIALGDEQYITIDAAQMEAYKDTLDNLKNRLVTGDYTNLALNPGENQISFSGSVEKYIVENYSRWL